MLPSPHASPNLITPTIAIVLLVLSTLPFWIERIGLYPYLGIEILIWSIYALGFNLLLGYTGLPSFGHGAYFGVGAYAFGLAQFNLLPNLWLCLFVAILAAALAGLFVAFFVSHRRGIYFALMTIAFGQSLWFVSIKWHSVTGGEDGLLKIARLPVELGAARLDLTSNFTFYYFVLVAFALVLIALWRLANSPFGRTLQAIRQNETRVTYLGYGVWWIKVAVFTLSAAISGFAGALFAMAQTSAFPDVMSLHQSGYIVMMTLVGGGLVSFWGPVLGVFAFLLTRDIIGAFTTAWMFWFGLFFVLVVLFKPEGLAGLLRDLRHGALRRNAPAAEPVKETGS